jgi:UDP-2,4-diacetamido-2,4,6-trideoxy-beta-L-altropyranose hydrolase
LAPDALAVVFDHYGLDAQAEIRALDAGKLVCVIDDLANRRHHCQLLLDPGFGRTAADYDHLILGEPTVLIGPNYALLRPEFPAAREAALARRKAASGSRVLVSLGLTDVGGVTARVCEALPYPTKVDAVLSSAAASVAALRDLPNVALHLDVRNMAELMSTADVAIGAGGSSTWERACLGLPTICLILADNQEITTRRLAQAGALIAVDARQPGFEHELVDALDILLGDPRRRAALSERSATLCDGLGAGRVADALLAKLASAPRA